MADLSDVETSLAAMIVQTIYPGGTDVPSVTGQSVKIFRGWPSPIGLNADLANNVASISIFSDPKTTRETTRYPRIWRTRSINPSTLTSTVNGRSLTFSGIGGVGQVAGIKIGSHTFAIALSSSDTALSVATAFAMLVPGAIQNGTTVSFPSNAEVEGRVVGSGTALLETRRQEQGITISVWCSNPSSRDLLTGTLDSALSSLDWLNFQDGSAGLLRYKGTSEVDTSENANLYRRDLLYMIEYPTVITDHSSQMLFGIGNIDGAISTTQLPASTVQSTRPVLGAIRFDAWYDPADPIDQECASALSQPAWFSRSPGNALVVNGLVSWPLADQMTLDNEILAAVVAGLDYWAFDSFKPGDGMNRALSLYLTSSHRPKLRFCMLGQTSNWADPSTPDGYASVIQRDVSMMSQAGYLRVFGDRPVYFVLDASVEQTSLLPGQSVAQAIAYVRRSAVAAGTGNPYIVWLSGAALAVYDNVPPARQVGADAAGAYACPRLSGTTENYLDLMAATTSDWADRASAGLDMVPTAMTGWDQRPLVETPQPFYPIQPGMTMTNYYNEGSPQEIARHISDMMTFTVSNSSACPSSLALIYAWNELLEGGWLTPTFAQPGPDTSRVDALGAETRAWSGPLNTSTFIV